MKDFRHLLKYSLHNEKCHYTKVNGIDGVYWIPLLSAQSLLNTAYFYGEQQSLELILGIIENGNTDVNDIKYYIKSKLGQFNE